jgi:GDP/UDP-N,N'-diacetylbacillosamine 2-epimerase (hydrolysing)
MGVLEAPFYKLPVVNIGNRQKGRLNAGNVEFVSYDETAIKQSIHTACFEQNYREKVASLENPFGDGHSADKIVSVLKNIDLENPKWKIKKKLC